MVCLTKTSGTGRKALLAEKRSRIMNDPGYQALLKRASSISAVRGADLGPHGISFKINELDAEAASDLLDLLSQFGLVKEEEF